MIITHIFEILLTFCNYKNKIDLLHTFIRILLVSENRAPKTLFHQAIRNKCAHADLM